MKFRISEILLILLESLTLVELISINKLLDNIISLYIDVNENIIMRED